MLKIAQVWIPCLRFGAPSNAASMRGGSTPYLTRAEALHHEHWASQAPWADAMEVEIPDAPAALNYVQQSVCQDILDGAAYVGGIYAKAAALILAGQRADGVLLIARAARDESEVE